MQILSTKYIGFVKICDTCGALLAYKPTDIYEGKYIYCPICKSKLGAQIDLGYEGVINNADENHSKTE